MKLPLGLMVSECSLICALGSVVRASLGTLVRVHHRSRTSPFAALYGNRAPHVRIIGAAVRNR
jgi:hypothetical protein